MGCPSAFSCSTSCVTTVTLVNSPLTPEVAAATDPRLWVLIPSYLLGPETWRGVGEVLDLLGHAWVSPAPARTTPRDDDHIGPWLDLIVETMPAAPAPPVVLVGHSGAGPRLPLVADTLLGLGYAVEAMILVNGRLPEGGVIPTERDSPMMDMLDALVRPDDYLPPWHRWWGPMIGNMLPGDEARDRILSEAKPTPRSLFDQPIPAPAVPESIGRGYLALGELYRPALDAAVDAGYEITRLEGEHLHMVVDPALVAAALVSLDVRCRWSARSGSDR